jgi:hypothetical protein
MSDLRKMALAVCAGGGPTEWARSGRTSDNGIGWKHFGKPCAADFRETDGPDGAKNETKMAIENGRRRVSRDVEHKFR